MKKGIILDLYEDEKIVMVLRRHWLAFVPTIIITMILLIIFIAGSIFSLDYIWGVDALNGGVDDVRISENLSRGALVVFGNIYLLCVIGFFYIAWLDYYLDVFVLTNKRIIRIEQLVLFGRRISETSYQHVQAVRSKVQGLLATIFMVGTVNVETAGDNENFSFTFMYVPADIATLILELQKEMWGLDGSKGDLSVSRKNEKIEAMNTGNNSVEGEVPSDKIVEPYKKEVEVADSPIYENDEARIIDKPEDIPEVSKEKDSTMYYKSILSSTSLMGGENNEGADKLLKNGYKDGRIITDHGVIWQSEQNPDNEVIDFLNKDGE